MRRRSPTTKTRSRTVCRNRAFERVVGFAATLFATAPANAQVETTAPVDEDVRTPTATRTDIDLRDVKAGDDAASKVSEAPGVHARVTSFGQTSYATIRGSNTRQVLVEIEGLRLNAPFGPGFDLGTSSGLGLDAVTVWRGAAATYRGSGALAGALEFRTLHGRKPGSGGARIDHGRVARHGGG